MKNKYINKVNTTTEAKFDYEECLEFGVLPKRDIQNSVEEYLCIKQSGGSRLNDYFRVRYLDEKTNTMLLLFIKKQHMFSTMLIWKICGICRETDFDEDFECNGINKSWYESPIDINGQPKTDWVKEIGNSEAKTYKITGLNMGVRNAFYHSGYKGIT